MNPDAGWHSLTLGRRRLLVRLVGLLLVLSEMSSEHFGSGSSVRSAGTVSADR